ncbi:MAG: peptidoglycan DD-metalloendopeptidase family protein [Flavobacteriia bacterium]|nr:peptidoglycan DD-metalloendopeptidase family protein [Flavobacteriia bacterium]OIP46420.1 MAG: peptidase M23 [Flavobacteriaceae bacterium CG2_30_31_66]PIV96530.1 MAG: peptidase M23 [Flavobacteriaceae bacterium CG17_big_fil_post_rev_8_21_14_2_50_31_13]PIX12423.1 MAG: peptidase M23 [Flavobacteriaceae bacterium CG_4_8_14_3_um_filter_31_8]PIY16052.1 MAG: peptidase M23 [Flavobacteriaceae bacterium CG_4_10_14_3_um_filter_31_253]PIZ09901.1 MAG: peptidase M23 [Flavobacteriaceae bacterium CG_4_10_14
MKKIVFLVVVIFSLSSCKNDEKKENDTKNEKKSEYRFGYKLDDYKVIHDTIKSGESFGIILDRHHVLYPQVNEIVTSIKEIFDVRKLAAGIPYTILASKDSTEKAQVFIYKHDKVKSTIVDFKDSIITATLHKKNVKIVQKVVTGVINYNLSVTMDSLGLPPSLTWTIADIYAWTLDFYKLQKGDSFKFVYDEKFIDDTTSVGYGNIKSAIFKHNRKNLYAFRYIKDSLKGVAEYYDEKGNMLKSMFLKAPIKFQYRISSKYNLNRKIAFYGNVVRPHRGTDFAANIGTPIIATASGTVIESAMRGGNGNFVKIQHNSTYTTQYLHMKQRKVKKGEYVKQGDLIGWVGMTGNTSGPHVCYRFWKFGKEVDPLREKFSSTTPIGDAIKPDYLKYISHLKYQLDNKILPVEKPDKATETIAKK